MLLLSKERDVGWGYIRIPGEHCGLLEVGEHEFKVKSISGGVCHSPALFSCRREGTHGRRIRLN